MKNIILHMFQWDLKSIVPFLPLVKKQGFTAIQISPIQPSKNCNSWWDCYQIFDFAIGNRYGTKEDLQDLCKEANKCDIKIIVDVVINHVASKDDDSLVPHERVSERLVTNPSFWKERRIINNWDNRWEVINYCPGLPALNLKNYDLQHIILNFLDELVSIGVGGFRIDCAKNIELPEEGSDFWKNIGTALKSNPNLFNYAELIFCEKELIDSYSRYINIATNSFGSDKNKLITYIESHDSFLEFGYTKKMNDDMIANEWEILLQNFNNVLFYTRPFSDLWKSDKIGIINRGNLTR